MANLHEPNKGSQGVTRRELLKTVSAVTVTGLSVLGGGKGTITDSTEVSASPLAGPRSTKKLRVCVVGGGFGRSFYWHEHPDCEVTAVSELRDDRRKLLIETYHCTKAYGDFHEMLGDRNVDAVAMFTPVPQHVNDCVDVLNAGKHVVCAVPAAYSLEECERLIDTVKKTGLTYMQAETGCYNAPTMTAYDLARDGKFGTIYYTQAEYLHDESGYHPGGKFTEITVDAKGVRTWRYGAPPAKYPTHATGPVIWVTDDPMTEVACIGWAPKNNLYADNMYHNRYRNATFLAKTRSGNASRIAIHTCFGGLGDIAERAEFWGTELVFIQDRFGSPALISREGENLAQCPVNDHADILPPNLRKYIKEGHAGAEVFITNEFVNAVLQGRPPVTDVYQGVAYCAPGICAQDSSDKDGEWVKVPDFGWHS